MAFFLRAGGLFVKNCAFYKYQSSEKQNILRQIFFKPNILTEAI